MDKIFKISASVAVLIIASSVAYYFFYFLPHKQKVLESARIDCEQASTEAMKKADLKNVSIGDGIRANELVFDKCMRGKGVSN